MNKKTTYALILVIAVFLFIRVFMGFFVIQPMGAIPDGATIVYWRTDLNLPFISSADGMILKNGGEVSLLSRGITLGAMAEPIMDRKILRLGYSETLYLWSTGGVSFEK